MRVRGLRAAALSAAACLWATWAFAAGLTVVDRAPEALKVRVADARPGQLYRITYADGEHTFVWENVSPDDAGAARLADDKHLRPEHRLRCESRLSRGDPVVFDDVTKGPVVGKRRVEFGVPVSTFGGPGYLVPGVSDLKRDDFGSFWLYLDRPPYAVLKYNAEFEYQFALLMPDRVLAHDLDADGNLYVLHPGNWVSKHGPLGEDVTAWELPLGRDPGSFVSASGLAIDRLVGHIYVADEALGRVQRFDLDMQLRPFTQTAWGWIGREDLAFTKPGQYVDGMYYQLDRPRQLRLDGRGQLFVNCEHYISRFSLATGRQLDFGKNPVLGWGGTFSDSVFSASAGLDGHWQRQWLAGVDGAGNIYVADRENEFVVDPRLQVFSPDGELLRVWSAAKEARDGSGRPVYITAAAGLAAAEGKLWIVDAAGRVYVSSAGGGLASGGRLYLGPGAAGRQFDLGQVEERGFSVETQAGGVRQSSEGLVLGFPGGERGTGNCEREGRPTLASGERSMWLVARLGEPFRVTLLDSEGEEVPPSQYSIEFEEKPGLFGSLYDFFRVTNHSGAVWENVHFVAETIE